MANSCQFSGNYCRPEQGIEMQTCVISTQWVTLMSNLNSPASLIGQQGFIGVKPRQAAQETQMLVHALDEIACGMIITDAQAQHVHSNLAGQLLLDSGQSLHLLKGCIVTTEKGDAPRFQEALSKAHAGKRSMLAIGLQQQTTLAVVPLERRHDFHQHEDQMSEAKPMRIALIFSRTGMCEALMMSFFARAHQLTRSEEQILGLLCVGLTAPEMAQQLRVGEATVRTHIRSICHKTHSNGIREVVKRLALLPPLMAAVMPSAFA